jgi:hypothetical protein
MPLLLVDLARPRRLGAQEPSHPVVDHIHGTACPVRG